ncbi:MAG: hypothetical protein AAB309_02980, partial [Deltaproteobacteria bacterium]
MNLNSIAMKYFSGFLAFLFSYTVCFNASAQPSATVASFYRVPGIIERLNKGILETETVSNLSDVINGSLGELMSIAKSEISQESQEKMIFEMDQAINDFNLVLAELEGQLTELEAAVSENKISQFRADEMARTLMHEFYYHALLKRFHQAPFKDFKELSGEAKSHAFHVINEHIGKGGISSFLKEVQLMEDQTSQGYPFAWTTLAIGGVILLIFLILYYSQEKHSLKEDLCKLW